MHTSCIKPHGREESPRLGHNSSRPGSVIACRLAAQQDKEGIRTFSGHTHSSRLADGSCVGSRVGCLTLGTFFKSGLDIAVALCQLIFAHCHFGFIVILGSCAAPEVAGVHHQKLGREVTA